MKKLITLCSTVTVMFLTTNNVQAISLGDMVGAAGALESGQTPVAIVPGATGTSLTGLLVQQLGVTQPQAEGGAGAIFQLAKSKMQSAAFSKLSSSVPGMQTLLAAAPAANSVSSDTSLSGLTSMAGAASGGSAGNLLGLAGSFQQLGLAPGMVQKFMPIVMQYVQGSGGGAVSSAFQSALMGGL